MNNAPMFSLEQMIALAATADSARKDADYFKQENDGLIRDLDRRGEHIATLDKELTRERHAVSVYLEESRKARQQMLDLENEVARLNAIIRHMPQMNDEDKWAKVTEAFNAGPGGNRIAAIKTYRELFAVPGWTPGLKECKDAVEKRFPIKGCALPCTTLWAEGSLT